MKDIFTSIGEADALFNYYTKHTNFGRANDIKTRSYEDNKNDEEMLI